MTANDSFQLAAIAAARVGFSDDFVKKVQNGEETWKTLVQEAVKLFGEPETIKWLEQKEFQEDPILKEVTKAYAEVEIVGWHSTYDFPQGMGGCIPGSKKPF